MPKHRGLTWFAVPTDAAGVSIQRIRQINGNSEFCQEFFDDVELTDDDRVGEVDDGWTVTQTMLFYERGGGATRGQGSGKSRTRVARDVADLARAGDRLSDPEVRDLVARVHVDDLVRSALGRRLVGLMAADPASAASVASYAKLSSGVFDPLRANLVMQIAGESGAVWDNETDPGAVAATGLLNSRFMAIAGGTDQMQRNSIGERVLGLPREPTFDSRKPFRDVVRDSRNWSGRVG